MLNIKQAILLCKLIEIGFDKLSPPPKKNKKKNKKQPNKNTSIEKKKQKMLLRTFDRDFF